MHIYVLENCCLFLFTFTCVPQNSMIVKTDFMAFLSEVAEGDPLSRYCITCLTNNVYYFEQTQKYNFVQTSFYRFDFYESYHHKFANFACDRDT